MIIVYCFLAAFVLVPLTHFLLHLQIKKLPTSGRDTADTRGWTPDNDALRTYLLVFVFAAATAYFGFGATDGTGVGRDLIELCGYIGTLFVFAVYTAMLLHRTFRSMWKVTIFAAADSLRRREKQARDARLHAEDAMSEPVPMIAGDGLDKAAAATPPLLQ